MEGTEGNPRTVLVTGGSGFLGGWCVATLLKAGHRVRVTVRDRGREAELRARLAPLADAGERLGFHLANLLEDEGWSEAVAGCDFVLHVASPFPPAQPQDPDELIVPARDGTLRVLAAALDAGVERVVLTSSVAAVRGGVSEAAAPLDESSWTDGDDERLEPYTRSKAIAERAAWDLVEGRGERERLAVVNPGAILGPVLGEEDSTSLQMVGRLLEGTPGIPRIGFSVVDVRDVADLHLLAMTAPAAGGERFVAVDRFVWMGEVAAILRARLGPAAPKVPKRELPDFLVRLIGRFDPSVRSVAKQLGQRVEVSGEKARGRLGWQTRPVEETVEECARSLLARGEA